MQVVTDQKMRSSRNQKMDGNQLFNVVTDQKMRSSRNKKGAQVCIEGSCNRLENAVKPQHQDAKGWAGGGCNRLENAVKPQPDRFPITRPQRCNRLENAVKPQQTTSEIRTWPDVSAYKMRSGCKHGQESQYCSLNTTDQKMRSSRNKNWLLD